MHDRILSNIHQIHAALGALAGQEVIKVALLSPQKRQFCAWEIQSVTIGGVEFTILPDIALMLQSTAVFDVAILCCHNEGEEKILFELRRRGLAALYGAWFWDNHHHHFVNLRIAMLADLVFVSHWHERHYLNHPASLAAGHIPAFSRQWSPGAITQHYPDGLPTDRRDALFGGFGRYGWAEARNRFIAAVAASCPDHALTLGAVEAYFQQTAAARLATWVAHKVQLIVPIAHDVSTRIFEALMTGQIPLVPDDVPDLDLVILPEDQAALPIGRYRAGDVESAKAEWQRAVARFDADGTAGVQRRHEFARDRHSLASRLADFAAFIRRPGSFNLDGDGRMLFWDRWR